MTTTKISEGAVLLRKKSEKAGRDVMAKQLMVAGSTLDHWIGGRRSPGLVHACKIRDVCKIKVDTWLIPPKK